MNTLNSYRWNSIKRRIVASIALVAFFFNSFAIPAQCAYAQESLLLPEPGVRVGLSPQFDLPILKGMKVYPDNPFRFDFILNKGNAQNSSS